MSGWQVANNRRDPNPVPKPQDITAQLEFRYRVGSPLPWCNRSLPQPLKMNCLVLLPSPLSLMVFFQKTNKITIHSSILLE